MEGIRTVWQGFARMMPVALLIGVVSLVAVAVAANGDPQLWQSYLLGFVPWLSLSLGCTGLMLLHHMVRGRWSYPLIRFFEAGAWVLPLLAVLYVPLFVFAKHIFPWADAEKVSHSPVLQIRAPYLNETGFLMRGAIYFAIWLIAVYLLTKWADQEDKTGDPNLVIKRTNFAAPWTVLFVLATTGVVTDLIMSLETEWFSTIYGLLWTVCSVLTTLAFATIYLLNVRKKEPFASFIDEKQQWRDMGNLMLTFTILWAYMSFSQYLIIWSGNLPEEIVYYAKRQGDLWTTVGTALIFLHFMLPFFLLLSSRLKRTPAWLMGTAVFILLIRLLDIVWNIVPSLGREGVPFRWTDVAAFIGIGGLWMGVFIWNLGRRQLMPEYLAVDSKEAHEHV